MREKLQSIIILAFALGVTLYATAYSEPSAAKAADYGISNPVKYNGVTSWDCIYFGKDYFFPNLIPDPEPEGELRKFGLMRKTYLENNRRGIYSGMLLSGELKKHLLMIQEQAEERFDLLVDQMAKKEGVTEQLKEQEQMLWVRRMNNIRARAEEIVREEIIYCL